MLNALMSGAFLTRERVRLWAIAVLAASLIAIAYLGVTAHGLNDYHGRPLGTDFSDVYAAGMLARAGKAADAYDWPRHHAAEQAIFGQDTPFYGWHYPPFFLIAAEGLAHLPYIPALLLWQGLTLALYLIALRALTKTADPALARDPLWLLVALAFPAVFVNLTHGQNGFLTTALLAGGLALLDKRPLLAGVVLGAMAYKPQFLVALPFALIAGRAYKPLITAGLTMAILAVLATLLFGSGIWTAFFDSATLSRTVVLEQGNTGFEKMQSAFAATRLLGGSIAAAYMVQGGVTLACLTALTAIWRSAAAPGVKGAALAFATTLSTPYAMDYDLVLLAIGIIFLAAELRYQSSCKGAALLLAALWLIPFIARPLAGFSHLVVAPLVIMTALAFLTRRALARF